MRKYKKCKICGKKLPIDAEDICFECQYMLEYSGELIENEFKE